MTYVKLVEEAPNVTKSTARPEIKAGVPHGLRPSIAVNGSYDSDSRVSESSYKFNSDSIIEDREFENNYVQPASTYKPQIGRSEKVIPINSKYNEVLRLAECGLNEVDIAKRLNMGKGEIQLIMGLNR